jgi:organic radical activating enzyme
MISPSEQRIIQIDVTNACPLTCSNCTRFCGHHAKPFFMEVDFFKKAVDSLKDFSGMVGMMGGEPTIHPGFEEMSEYLYHARPEPDEDKRHWLKEAPPLREFADYIKAHLSNTRKRRGLWSMMPPAYFKRFAQIQRWYPYQCLDDHKSDNVIHQAILTPRREYGIGDKEWVARRDNCWLQRKWSASITPKGAFPCEIMASLDMLFDGPGGWPVEPGWWRTPPEQFGNMLNWCEWCGIALRVPWRVSKEGVDDVSPVMYERLKRLGSKKRMCCFPVENYRPDEWPDTNAGESWMPYLATGDHKDRIGG